MGKLFRVLSSSHAADTRKTKKFQFFYNEKKNTFILLIAYTWMLASTRISSIIEIKLKCTERFLLSLKKNQKVVQPILPTT